MAWYPTRIPGVDSGPPVVGQVLQAAHELGMRVQLGLFLGDWNHSSAVLKGLTDMNKKVASELFTLYDKAFPGTIKGFHLPLEFKNCVNCSQRGWDGQINFNTPELRARLVNDYLGPSSDHIKHALSARLDVSSPPSFFDHNSFRVGRPSPLSPAVHPRP